jgi:ABC-type uncharacterized transport system YnjBCD permease subunit
MSNPVRRSALVAAGSAVVAIVIAIVGAFVIPMPDRDPVEFLYYVMLLVGLPAGTLLTLVLRDVLGTSGLWNHVVVGAVFAVLNWTLIGILYGALRRWLTTRDAAAGRR